MTGTMILYSGRSEPSQTLLKSRNWLYGNLGRIIQFTFFMNTYRWVIGLAVALAGGGFITQYYARRIKILVGENDSEYRLSIPISIGLIESLFFTIGVAFNISGVMIAMVGWMGAKMAAHWGEERHREKLGSVGTIRFLMLTGTLASMFFSIIGGLICAGKITF